MTHCTMSERSYHGATSRSQNRWITVTLRKPVKTAYPLNN